MTARDADLFAGFFAKVVVTITAGRPTAPLSTGCAVRDDVWHADEDGDDHTERLWHRVPVGACLTQQWIHCVHQRRRARLPRFLFSVFFCHLPAVPNIGCVFRCWACAVSAGLSRSFDVSPLRSLPALVYLCTTVLPCAACTMCEMAVMSLRHCGAECAV